MIGVIIAAGEGTRFGEITKKIPKPLIPIENKFLIQWVMDSLIGSGINEIIIVTGYRGKMLMEKLGKKYREIPLKFIYNKLWEKGNLTSLYATKDSIHEDFILSMADHLFDPTIVKNIIKSYSDTTVLLAVDRKYQQVDDDMKVMVAPNRYIKNIGKTITGNYVDIGLFKMKSKIFEYAAMEIENRNYQLFRAIYRAAMHNDAKIMDINRRFWIDVDTQQELKSYYVQKYPEFIKNGKWD